MVSIWQFEFKGELLIEAFFAFVLYIFIEADSWADWDVFIGLDEQQSMVKVRNWRHHHKTVSQKVELTHILYYSLKLI